MCVELKNQILKVRFSERGGGNIFGEGEKKRFQINLMFQEKHIVSNDF
jgi:hypothetical protein